MVPSRAVSARGCDRTVTASNETTQSTTSLLFLADLRRVLAEDGCPLCHLRRQADERYLRSVLREGAMDAGLLDRLLSSGGFCREHTWRLVRLEEKEEHDALTNVIILQPLVEAALEELAALSERRRRGERGEKRRRRVVAACPACEARRQLEVIFASELTQALTLPDIAERFRSRRQGLCRDHFRQAWAAAADAEVRQLLREAQVAQVETLRTDLSEYVRKHKHQYRDEPAGREQDSHRRAAELLAGLPDDECTI